MLHYYIDDTSVTIELLVTNNQDPITNLAPTVCIRDKDTSGSYYDFNSNTFTSTTTSATAVLLSGTAGVYGFKWDVSGKMTTNMQLTFEYRWGTAAATDDVIFTRVPLVTADVTTVGGLGGGGGGGIINLEGFMSEMDKSKLFSQLDRIEETTDEFRRQSVAILRGLLAKKALTKADLADVIALKERDLEFFQALVQVLNLYEEVTSDKLFEALNKYIHNKETKVEELIDKIEHILPKKKKKEEPKEDWPEYGDDE